jgi:hypothetical protein
MALSANAPIVDLKDFSRYKQKVASGAIHFYKGAICNFNSSLYVKLGGDTSGELFAGIALEELEQASGGSNGDESITLIPAKSGAIVELTLPSVAQANLYSSAYVNGDDAVALVGTTSNDVRVGTIVALSNVANKCFVRLD